MMEENNLWKMLDRNSNADVGGFVVMWIITIVFLLLVIFIISMEWWVSTYLLLILPIFVFMLSFFWYMVIKWHKKNSSIETHIKNGTVIIKKAKIEEIKEYRGDGSRDSYLIVVASDWSSTFEKRITIRDRQTFSGCAIWDVVNVYVDPDDSKNYLMEV